MKATQQLHALGQSLWLDNITRDLLTSGTLQRYIDDLSVTGLTSNPIDLRSCVARSHSYDAEIRRLVEAGKSDEALFFELGGARISRRPRICSRRSTSAPLGWMGSSRSRSRRCWRTTRRGPWPRREALHAKANRPNLFIKIPGTLEGLPAIEETIFAGVPVNVTLLFSRDDYLRAADAYMRGLERRVAAGLSPGRALGCVGVRQPLGQGDDGQGARRTA